MNDYSFLKLSEIIGEPVVGEFSVGGGCIADSKVINGQSGKSYFLKRGFSNGMFYCEANGLKEIAKSSIIRIPEVIGVGDDFLLLEYIASGVKKRNFFESFGEKLALMHQFSQSEYGFYENNFIGSTVQKNDYSNTWADFYFRNRLLYQYRLLENKHAITSELKSKFKLLEKKVIDILDSVHESASLLHGDLWGGNYMVDEKGEPVLIDPAVYYGHRETDLAMTKLFGGFSAVFYEVYNQINPLEEGYSYRENIYLLYHVMNHLNLFGSGYYRQTISLIDYYL